jgi:hypothetical protein
MRYSCNETEYDHLMPVLSSSQSDNSDMALNFTHRAFASSRANVN